MACRWAEEGGPLEEGWNPVRRWEVCRMTMGSETEGGMGACHGFLELLGDHFISSGTCEKGFWGGGGKGGAIFPDNVRGRPPGGMGAPGGGRPNGGGICPSFGSSV
jgi:hypothetical protein